MAKRRIEIVSCTESYQNLSSFESIEQLNETVRAYKEKLKGELNKTELAVLDLLHRYSAKYTGVSFLTKNHIAELVGRKRRTIIYICKRLEELGVIKQLEMKRTSDMRQTSNAIVIQPIQEEKAEKVAVQEEICTQEEEIIAHHENNISLKQLHNNINTIRKGDVEEAKIPMPNFIPKEFADLATCYYKDTQSVFELWGKIRLAYIHRGLEKPLQELTDVAVKAFRESVAAIKLRNLKKGRSFDSFRGYLYGTASKLFGEERRKEVSMQSFDVFADILGGLEN